MKLNKKQMEQIRVLAEKFELSVDDLKEQFKELLGSKQLASREEKLRPNIAMRMLLAQLTNKKDRASFGGKTEDVIIRVEAKEEPTAFKRGDGGEGFRSSVYVTAQMSGDPFFSVLTLWNDANEVNPQLVVGGVYATKVVSGSGGLSMNNPEELNKTEDKLPPMSDVITDSYPVVELENVELNISDDYNDLKNIKGIIASAWTKETRNGKMMGFLKIISEDGADTMVAKFSRIYEQVNYWDTGSLVYVLGQVTAAVYDEDTGETIYDVSAWGNLIVPIDAFEKETETPDPGDEDEDFEAGDIDVDGDDVDGDDDWDVDDEEDWDE